MTGPDVAIAYDPATWLPRNDMGTPTAFHGTTGRFVVQPTGATLPDFRARGTLQAGTGRYPRLGAVRGLHR